MTDEQRQELIRLLQQEDDISPEWARILFPPEKREYELVYHGKTREEDIIADSLAVPLQPVRTFGGNGRDWHNMLIFGDNLQVMKSLLETKKDGRLCNSDGTEGVRLIYIDPPFATKQEFEGSQDQKAYRDKITGAEFLEFLRSRLIFMRKLLSDDGHIFVHVDYRKGHYLKVLLDEIFQENNLRNEIILPGRASKNLQQQFREISRLNVRHDNLFWYSSSVGSKVSPLWIEKHNKGNPEGHWHHFWSTANRPTMRYRLFGIKPETGQWVWEEVRAKKAVESYRRFLDEGGGRTLAEYWRDAGRTLEFIRKNPDDGSPQYWRAPAEDRIADTVWSGIPVYSNSTKYPTEKNEKLLAQIIGFVTSPGDIVMDAFAGSGTTLAVAEKLGRRWIGIDCGKLAIYTMQRRMLNLREEIGNKGAILEPKPFTLYNAGLYDFSKLKELAWEDWRFFALQLFQCRDEPHRIAGIDFDGYRQGASVLVFNHLDAARKGARITEETIEEIHEAVGSRVSGKVFIIAPALTFDFQQDYISIGKVRYYALRIPYSIIHELHRREFTALKQPSDEMAVNDTVESVGFDFIRTPELRYKTGSEKKQGGSGEEGYIKVETFKSDAVVREPFVKKENLETLSMVMLDFDYDEESKLFDFDEVHYANEISEDNWKIRFNLKRLGKKMMAVFVDIYGNEARLLINKAEFNSKTANKQGNRG
jgi:site-specific DNA-methyltransferase (adenine-specific)/adenine-specific DNA-methyltransferase